MLHFRTVLLWDALWDGPGIFSFFHVCISYHIRGKMTVYFTIFESVDKGSKKKRPWPKMVFKRNNNMYLYCKSINFRNCLVLCKQPAEPILVLFIGFCVVGLSWDPHFANSILQYSVSTRPFFLPEPIQQK